MKIKTQHLIEGEGGLGVIVPDGMSRIQTAMRLTELGAKILRELDEDDDEADDGAEADDEAEDGAAVSTEAYAGVEVVEPETEVEEAEELEEEEEEDEDDEDEVVVPESPLEFDCPTCEQGEDQPCVDTRPGREGRSMAGFHPERKEVYRDARDEAKAALRGE